MFGTFASVVVVKNKGGIWCVKNQGHGYNKRTDSFQTPEDKLVGFYIAAPLLAAAFWWFAWTIPPYGKRDSPVISSLSIILMGFAINEFDYVLIGYIVDTYSSIAASACAPLGFLRAILSAVFPIVGARMFDNINNNVAASILAGNATAYVGIAIAFYFFGQAFRKASPWARRQLEKEARRREFITTMETI